MISLSQLKKDPWWSLWWLALAAKFILGGWLPLSNDEAYYWVWSHHLQWSYYDHPAGVAWLFWLGQPLEGLRDIGLSGAVRWPAILLGHFALILIRKLLTPFLTEKQHVQWLAVILLSPFFGLGSLIITPDVPLVFSSALTLLAFRHYVDSTSVKNAALFGAALGIGFCSKYHIVLFVPIAVLFLLVNKRWSAFRFPALATAVLAGLVTSAPVWGWNMAHDWASFRFQLNHGLEKQTLSTEQLLMQVGDYVGAQLGLLSPLVVFTAFRRVEGIPVVSILRWFGWGTVAFFLWTSFRSPVEANWPIAGHLVLLIVAALADTRGWLRKGMMTIWGLAMVVVLVQAAQPERSIFPVPVENLKTYEFVRFRDLEPLAKESGEGVIPLYASSYQMAGALSFASLRTVPKLKGINRKDFFDYGTLGDPVAFGLPAFRVAMESAWPWPEWISQNGYHQVKTEAMGRFQIITFEKAI